MSRKPLILVTNDDGIASPGLKAAVRGALKIGDVLVAAPHCQQTAMGRAFPRISDLGIIEERSYEVSKRKVPAYAVHGSPAYSVAYGILELAPRKPDLCISGINYGENVGMTLTSSGTIGAALEARSHGVPSMAVSIQAELSVHRSSDFQEYDWEIPEKVVEKWADWILKNSGQRNIDILNINIPAGAQDPEDYRITTQSRQNCIEFCRPPLRDRKLPFSLQTQWQVDQEALEKESDIYAMYTDHIISVTPLSTIMSLPSSVMSE